MKEILITSSVLILAIIFLRFLFRNKVSRQLIYGAWLLVALRLLIPVQIGNLNFSVLTPAKPVISGITDIAQRPVSGPSREEAYSDALKAYLSQGDPVFVPQVQEQVESQIQQGRPKQEVYDELLESNKPETIVLPEINREIEIKVSKTATPTVGQIATAVWIAGMVAMAVWFAAVNLSFHRKLRASAATLDLPGSKVPVKVSPVLTSPCLFGLWRPTVYITPVCADNGQTRHHVLTHELTHLHHGDHIWSWVRCVCLCIYWFNPLVWIAASLSKRDCELACDEAALKKLGEGERIAYGKTLLDMVSSVPAPGQLLETATAMHETKKQLKERMKCIVKKPKVFLTAAIILLVVLTVITGCTFSGAFDGPNSSTPGNTQPSTTPTQTTTTTAPTQPTEPPIPTVDEVINCTYETEGGIDGFSNFYYIFAQDWDDEESGSITVTRTESDGTQTVIELSGKARSNFKYKVGDTTLSFRYLVYCQYTGTKEDDFEYLEYFLMANDPNATYLDTLEMNGASAVIVYAEYLDRTVSRAESFGNVPEGVQTLAGRDYTPILVPYLKDSIFFEDDDGTLKRYDYNGNLITCLDSLPEEKTYKKMREMPDGGFVIVISTRTPNEDTSKRFYNTIVCYDKDGKQRWEYAPADKYDLSSVGDLFVHNNTIYVYSSGTFVRLSLDGNLIDQKVYDTNPRFSRIVPVEDGFEVYLSTPERSDDFPISENGEKYIKAILDFACNIVSIAYVEDWVGSGESGILGDKYYFIDDPIFDISDKDRLPAGHRIGGNKIFSLDGGYVIVRKHLLDECHMWRASGPVDNYYYEAILTGYDHDGNPLWQTTSLIMAPLSPSYTKTNGK